MFFPNETSFWETPLRIKEKASDRWENLIAGPNPAADFVRARGPVFFGAPLDLGGDPLDLPCGASGRLGGDVSAPAAGSCFFFKFVGACGGLLFFQFCTATAAVSCFSKLLAPAAGSSPGPPGPRARRNEAAAGCLQLTTPAARPLRCCGWSARTRRHQRVVNPCFQVHLRPI